MSEFIRSADRHNRLAGFGHFPPVGKEGGLLWTCRWRLANGLNPIAVESGGTGTRPRMKRTLFAELRRRSHPAFDGGSDYLKAYAGLFTEGADLVNVVGWWWKGRAEIERKLTVAYAHMFKDSTLTITEVQVRFLTPQIAVAHARWTMVGARPPPGLPEPRAGLQTLILKKHAGQWLIDVFQNTNAIPEVAFAPPTQGAKPSTR